MLFLTGLTTQDLLACLLVSLLMESLNQRMRRPDLPRGCGCGAQQHTADLLFIGLTWVMWLWVGKLLIAQKERKKTMEHRASLTCADKSFVSFKFQHACLVLYFGDGAYWWG